MNFINIMGLNIFNDNLDKIVLTDKIIIINTISPNSFSISLKDKVFNDALRSSEYLVLDGLYFGLAPLLLKGKLVKKNSGTDCFYHFMNLANQNSWKVFFLGSSNETLEKIKKRSKKDFININIEYFSPPFSNNFSELENNEIIFKINKFNPDVLFIGMTAPKQEKWAYLNKDLLNTKVTCTIGNVFDWYAGVQKQPEKIWVNLGLEWLIRTIRRPEILKRYPNIFYFFWILFLNLIRLRKD